MSERDSDRFVELSLALLLVVALVGGGGPRGWGDFAVQLAAVPALVALVVRPRIAAMTGRRWLLWWAAVLALPALQLLPLPVALWARLPERAGVLADLARAGVHPRWLPFSLDPWGTLRAGLALVPPAIAFAATRRLDAAARQRVLAVVLATAAAMALLGFSQAAAGEYAPLRLYAYHHPVGAIGTFANRNHFADLLAMLVPAAIGLAWTAHQHRRPAAAALAAGCAVVLFLAAALSFSRAGFALCIAATVATLAVVLASAGARRWFAPLAGAGVAAVAVAAYAWDGLSQRLAQDPLDDLRWQYLHYAPRVAAQYLPWGSGLGSWKWVYAAIEPVDAMRTVYAGHAHNDLVQTAVEAGVPGLVLVAALLLGLGADTLRTFRVGKAPARGDHALRRAIGIAVGVPVLHSLVDYPLRTLAVATVFAVFLAWPHGPKGPAHGRTVQDRGM